MQIIKQMKKDCVMVLTNFWYGLLGQVVSIIVLCLGTKYNLGKRWFCATFSFFSSKVNRHNWEIFV